MFHRITKLNKVLAKNAWFGIRVPCSTWENSLYQWLDLLSVRRIHFKTLQYEVHIQIVSSLSAFCRIYKIGFNVCGNISFMKNVIRGFSPKIVEKPEMFQDDIGYWYNFACLHITCVFQIISNLICCQLRQIRLKTLEYEISKMKSNDQEQIVSLLSAFCRIYKISVNVRYTLAL